MSDDLISRRALYERAATLEAQALDYVGKLIERDGEETSVEWRIWSAILTERTAFKHDVFDAPSAQPNTPTDAPTDTTTAQRTGRWIKNDNDTYSCDQCHSWIPNEQHYYARYCIFCGARMEEQE